MKTQPYLRVCPTAVSSAFGPTVVPFRPRTAPPDSCLVRFHTRPEAQLRLYCFPWSGAGASAYRSHAEAIPAEIEMVGIQFPGRGTRRAEPSRTELQPLATQIAEAIRADLDASPSRYAVLGHSYGSLLAYESIRLLQTAGLFPELAIMSGSRAPSVAPHTLLHRLDDVELARQLGRMGGLSPDRLRDQSFLGYLLPIARSDLTACEPRRPLSPRFTARSLPGLATRTGTPVRPMSPLGGSTPDSPTAIGTSPATISLLTTFRPPRPLFSPTWTGPVS
jgi:surfactin synthase thioesterase subunit